MDELNPITGLPYKSKAEYDAVRRLSPQEIARRRAGEARKRLAEAKSDAENTGNAPTSGAVQSCPAEPQPAPVPQPAPQTRPRKYPDQTCEDEVREELHDDKDHKCNDAPRSCKNQSLDCVELLRRIQRNKECLAARERIRDECFGGVGDQPHADEITGVQNVLS